MIRTAIALLFALSLAAGPKHPSSHKCTSCARDSEGRITRSKEATKAFEHADPCPSTGKRSGPCAGYVIDHVKPLACGGADKPSNMQWQSKTAAKAKDRTERDGCTK